MYKTESAGGVVVNQQGEILVVSQHGTSWSLPKGHLDAGEDFMTAAKREIYEESGVSDLEYIRDLGTYERFKIGKSGGEDEAELKVITIFLFHTKQTDLKPIDPENPEAKWVKKEDVVNLLTHPKDKEFWLSVIASV